MNKTHRQLKMRKASSCSVAEALSFSVTPQPPLAVSLFLPFSSYPLTFSLNEANFSKMPTIHLYIENFRYLDTYS